MMPPELSAIPPILRRKRTPVSKTRRALALAGFTLAYIALPLALIAGIYTLNTLATAQADRASGMFYSTTS